MRARRAGPWIGLACAIFAVACDDGAANGSGPADAGLDARHAQWDGGPLPTCTWPAALDPTDASDGRCAAARALVTCTFPGGVTEDCKSDDPTRCPDSDSGQGNPLACHDACEPNEYAISCGRLPGPADTSPPPDPPPACRLLFPTPAGVYYECCPCGG